MIHSGFLNFGVDVFFFFFFRVRVRVSPTENTRLYQRKHDPLNWYHCLRIKRLQNCVN